MDADERTRALYIAKNLKSRHMWMGEVVHWAVEGVLRELKLGREARAEEVLKSTTERMRKDFKESRDGLYRRNPKRHCGLYEHEYNVDVQDGVWFNLHERARSCILHLLESKILGEIKRIPPVDWLALEGLLDFNLEGDKIYLKMDFAARVDGGVLIIDWKTGEQADVDSQVQLSCYGLYAVVMWHTRPDEVTTTEYNLATRTENRSRLLPANIDWIKHYIRSSVTAMKELLADPKKNIAREDDFPFTDNELTCEWCNFKKLCKKFL